jgi:hydrogenase/urease accessory protein HupE
MRAALTLLSLCILVVLPGPAAAHGSPLLYIEITERAPQQYLLRWKAPRTVAAVAVPRVSLAEACRRTNALTERSAPWGWVRQESYRCPGGLGGERLTISYPRNVSGPPLSTLVRFATERGEVYTAVLRPLETTWVVPRSETPVSVARQYVLLGIEHIASGLDHLLFIGCLLLIAGSGRRIVVTITGFTLAHSVTLILSALKLAHLPSAPVEVAIALSIVLLAAEIGRGRRDSLTWRYPITVSSSFGLLHGFGFAAALGDVGLPQRDLVIGLIAFNLGVEIGQLLFAAALLGLAFLLKHIPRRQLASPASFARYRLALAYGVGTIAVFWMIQRSAEF